jgi:hypothetical protein
MAAPLSRKAIVPVDNSTEPECGDTVAVKVTESSTVEVFAALLLATTVVAVA